jgi:hypothetical protein
LGGKVRSFLALPPFFRILELRKLIALLFALLLPLQTLASLVMPLQLAGQSVAMEAEHCPGHGGDAANDEQPVPNSLACEQCGVCHLACAGMMPSAEATPAGFSVNNIFLAAADRRPASHTPEEPNPPPVATRS